MKKQCPHPVFGVPLQLLIVGEEKIPLVVDRLITTIEMYGLYTEGIYRKSGVIFFSIVINSLLFIMFFASFKDYSMSINQSNRDVP